MLIIGRVIGPGFLFYDIRKVDLEAKRKKDFIGVIFKCCNKYSGIYLDEDRSSFLGWCPKCGATMEIRISPNGSASRFFQTD